MLKAHTPQNSQMLRRSCAGSWYSLLWPVLTVRSGHDPLTLLTTSQHLTFTSREPIHTSRPQTAATLPRSANASLPTPFVHEAEAHRREWSCGRPGGGGVPANTNASLIYSRHAQNSRSCLPVAHSLDCSTGPTSSEPSPDDIATHRRDARPTLIHRLTRNHVEALLADIEAIGRAWSSSRSSWPEPGAEAQELEVDFADKTTVYMCSKPGRGRMSTHR